MLTLEQIHIRDPFIVPVPAERKYFLYGTTGSTCWDGRPAGFEAYESTNLSEWNGPIPVFRPSEDFWADRHFWAPEVHHYHGKYYMFASFKSGDRRRGTQILIADHPVGPFVPHSDGPVTPADWECLDGTLYVDEANQPWIVFCHEWVQTVDGEICASRLTPELDAVVGDPVLLFRASEGRWSAAVGDKQAHVTDGPFLYRTQEGTLLMLWSTTGVDGYAMGTARSISGTILGPWVQDDEPLYSKDGGHGMLFRTFEGELMMTIHRPNSTPHERPVIAAVTELDGALRLANGGQ